MSPKIVSSIPMEGEKHGGVHKFGRNPVIDTNSDPEDVWGFGGIKTFLTQAAATTLYISSDNQAADVGIEITVIYLDADGIERTVVENLHAVDARTFVSLGVTGFRVQRAYVSDAGNLTGNVYISSDNTDAGGNGIPDDTTKIEGFIRIGDNQTTQAIYTVPAGKKANVVGWYANMISQVGSSRAIVRIAQILDGEAKRTVEIGGISVAGVVVDRIWPMSMEFPSLTVLLIEVVSTSHNALDCSGGYYLWLEDN
jgi:hypothetical protein